MNNQERNQIKKLLESARVPEEILNISVRWQIFKEYVYQLPTDTSLLIDFPKLAPILSGVQLDVFQKSVYEELQEARKNADTSTTDNTFS